MSPAGCGSTAVVSAYGDHSEESEVEEGADEGSTNGSVVPLNQDSTLENRFSTALGGSIRWPAIFMPSLKIFLSFLGTAELVFRFGGGLLNVPASAPTETFRALISRVLKAELPKEISSKD